MKPIGFAAPALVAAVLAGSAASATAPGPATRDATDAVSSESRTKLKLKRSPYGKVLFGNGYALYRFTSDGAGQTRCRGRCARAWPPLVAGERIEVVDGVKRRLIGTIERPNGTEQITYDGQPLYGYVDDPRGEVFCHDVDEFGGTWYAVRRSGAAAPAG